LRKNWMDEKNNIRDTEGCQSCYCRQYFWQFQSKG
jgi:hypothetical protein